MISLLWVAFIRASPLWRHCLWKNPNRGTRLKAPDLSSYDSTPNPDKQTPNRLTGKEPQKKPCQIPQKIEKILDKLKTDAIIGEDMCQDTCLTGCNCGYI